MSAVFEIYDKAKLYCKIAFEVDVDYIYCESGKLYGYSVCTEGHYEIPTVIDQKEVDMKTVELLATLKKNLRQPKEKSKAEMRADGLRRWNMRKIGRNKTRNK